MAIELGFKNTDIYYWLGEAYYMALLERKLIMIFRTNEIKGKNNYTVDFNKLYDEAINTVNKAIELKPDYKNNYLVLGDIYRINGQLELARDNYKKATKIIKPISLESDKYMVRYYKSRKELDKKIFDTFKSGCDSGNAYSCSWLSVSTKLDPIKSQIVPAGSIELDPIVSP